MKTFYRKGLTAAALFVLCFIFPQENFAQERMLTKAKLQNFVKNFGEINEALDDMDDNGEIAQMYAGFEEFAELLFSLAYANEPDIASLKVSYQKLLNLKLPSTDKVFSKNGLNPQGYRSFIVIFIGVTISLYGDTLKTQIQEMLEQYGGNNDEVNAAINVWKKNLTLLREILHPGDFALVEDNKEKLMECF